MSKSESQSDLEKLESNQKDGSTSWQILEMILNTVNHMFVGITTFYLTWYCFNYGFTGLTTWHVYLSTIGFQLLMAEAMMTFYSYNSFSMLHTNKTKRHLHWILQSLGAILAIAGTIIEIYNHWHKVHFTSTHGMLGLAACIMLIITLLNGICAYFAVELRKMFRPVFSKLLHNIFAITTFVVGMASIVDAYLNKRYVKTKDPGDVRYWMATITVLMILLTVIAPLKTAYHQVRTIFR